jgi:hypothetical protein
MTKEDFLKVYAVDTNEPLSSRFEAGVLDGLVLYSTRQKAEADKAEYEANFGPGSAWVIELEVW